MPPDAVESKAGEVYADLPQEVERRSRGLKYLKRGLKDIPDDAILAADNDEDEDEEEAQAYRVIVVRSKGESNPKNFSFEVVEPQRPKSFIKRNLTDMVWLRSNLRKDFPYSYVQCDKRRCPPSSRSTTRKPSCRTSSTAWRRCLT